jgi:hypothetical protein
LQENEELKSKCTSTEAELADALAKIPKSKTRKVRPIARTKKDPAERKKAKEAKNEVKIEADLMEEVPIKIEEPEAPAFLYHGAPRRSMRTNTRQNYRQLFRYD